MDVFSVLIIVAVVLTKVEALEDALEASEADFFPAQVLVVLVARDALVGALAGFLETGTGLQDLLDAALDLDDALVKLAK